MAFAIFAIVVAILGSWTALELQRQVRSHEGRKRSYWLVAASVAMGISIFSMNYIAILGYDAGVSVSYDMPLTFLSLFMAVSGTAFAFISVQTSRPSWGKVAIAGTAMGCSIAIMHYLGMASMRFPGEAVYHVPTVIASVLIAISVSTAAIETAIRAPGPAVRILGAIVLGFAISSMHFVAMEAVSFVDVQPLVKPGQIDEGSLAMLVGMGTTVLLLMALGSAAFDRRFEELTTREAQAVAENELHLRQILTHMPLGIIAVSEDAVDEALYTNDYAERILNGISPFRLPFVDNDGNLLPEEQNPFRRVIRGEGWPAGEQIRIQLPNNGFGFLEITATRLQEITGNASEHVFMINDITARVEAEMALMQAQKIETIGQLTGGVAHDFNNLLTPIIGGIEMLRREKNLSMRAERVLQGAAQASQRAATLVQRLLAFARQQTLQTKTVDTKSLLLGLQDLIERTIGPTIEVMFAAPEDLGVHIDPGQLELAILNLCVNSRDAMPDGGRLDISADAVELVENQIKGLPAGDFIRITVADTGSGMPEETVRRAIEPFFSTKGLGKGTGLGLSMVHGLAAQSKGQLVIQSEPGKGTRVDIYLPQVQIDKSVEEAPQSDRDSSGDKRYSILLVDDEELVRVATADILEELGHKVVQASSGIQALTTLRSSNDIQLVVSDHLMPGMTGATLASEMTTQAPGVPILILTGYANPDELPPHLPILTKPFRQDDLARAIRALISNKENGVSLKHKKRA